MNCRWLLVVSLVVLSACKQNNELNTTEGVERIKHILTRSFGPEKEVYALQLVSDSHLSSNLGYVEVFFLEDGVAYSQMYQSNLGTRNELQEPKAREEALQKEFYLKRKQGKLRVADFDYHQIVSKYREALDMIPEGYEHFFLRNWKYMVKNNGQVWAFFTIEGTKEGEEPSMQERGIITNYYEFRFSMTGDGAVSLAD